jgi:hypothetical protein
VLDHELEKRLKFVLVVEELSNENESRVSPRDETAIAERAIAKTHLLARVGDHSRQDANPPMERHVRLDRGVGRSSPSGGSPSLELETNVGVAEAPILLERLGRVGPRKARDELRDDASRVGSSGGGHFLESNVEREVEEGRRELRADEIAGGLCSHRWISSVLLPARDHRVQKKQLTISVCVI